jgi:hypothetical protein
MEKRAFWPFIVKNFPQDMNIPTDEFEIDPNITKMIYEHRFCGKPKGIHHIRKFNERRKVLKLNHSNNEIIKVKPFPCLLAGKALDWISYRKL